MTDDLVRPGPSSVKPGLSPAGVVIHAYAVPTERLILVRFLTTDNVEQAAPLDADDAFNRLQVGEIAVCLVAYDGDTGERTTLGHAPGPLA